MRFAKPVQRMRGPVSYCKGIDTCGVMALAGGSKELARLLPWYSARLPIFCFRRAIPVDEVLSRLTDPRLAHWERLRGWRGVRGCGGRVQRCGSGRGASGESSYVAREFGLRTVGSSTEKGW